MQYFTQRFCGTVFAQKIFDLAQLFIPGDRRGSPFGYGFFVLLFRRCGMSGMLFAAAAQKLLDLAQLIVMQRRLFLNLLLLSLK